MQITESTTSVRTLGEALGEALRRLTDACVKVAIRVNEQLNELATAFHKAYRPREKGSDSPSRPKRTTKCVRTAPPGMIFGVDACRTHEVSMRTLWRAVRSGLLVDQRNNLGHPGRGRLLLSVAELDHLFKKRPSPLNRKKRREPA